VPVLDLDAIEIDLDTARLVDEKLMRRHRVLPLFRRGRRVYVGVSDPTRLQAIDEIKFATGMSIEAIVVEDNKLDAVLMRLTEALDTTFQGLGGDDIDLENIDVSEDRDDAGADRPRRDRRRAHRAFRQQDPAGRDQPWGLGHTLRALRKVLPRPHPPRRRAQGDHPPPVALANKVTARIKVMSRMDIAERRVPQDGRIKLKLSANRAIDFRVNTLPTLYGEKVVMRILDPSQAKLGIDALGYEDFQKQLYLDALSKPYGMILVTGPTGSGKTVSLYTGLNILNTDDRNISTAEDPAEINLPGVNQVNVNPRVGLTFATALRAFLRQDPDIIMVGEIRDLETAEIAIKAAQTGHLVLSTLHTNDAPKTLTRMVDMGVAPYAIASSVSLIIAQRLARRLCESCKEPREIPRRRCCARASRSPRSMRASRSMARSAAASATTATRAARASSRSCRCPRRSAGSSWRAATRCRSRPRPTRKASGTCGARGCSRSRTASPASRKSIVSRSTNLVTRRQ
jgi:type IV pilus assembly protein PilB